MSISNICLNLHINVALYITKLDPRYFRVYTKHQYLHLFVYFPFSFHKLFDVIITKRYPFESYHPITLALSSYTQHSTSFVFIYNIGNFQVHILILLSLDFPL